MYTSKSSTKIRSSFATGRSGERKLRSASFERLHKKEMWLGSAAFGPEPVKRRAPRSGIESAVYAYTRTGAAESE